MGNLKIPRRQVVFLSIDFDPPSLSLVNTGKEVLSMKSQDVGQEITTPVYSAFRRWSCWMSWRGVGLWLSDAPTLLCRGGWVVKQIYWWHPSPIVLSPESKAALHGSEGPCVRSINFHLLSLQARIVTVKTSWIQDLSPRFYWTLRVWLTQKKVHPQPQ